VGSDAGPGRFSLPLCCQTHSRQFSSTVGVFPHIVGSIASFLHTGFVFIDILGSLEHLWDFFAPPPLMMCRNKLFIFFRLQF
jgi:hypothetical protein